MKHRTERYTVQRAPGAVRTEIRFRKANALSYAGGRWLKCVLMFDADECCWTLQVPGIYSDYLKIVDLNETLTRPRADIPEAKRWAARLLEADEAAGEDGECDWWLDGELWVPARITEWRVVCGRGWSGYTPLFNLTPPCVMTVHDLDPATGAQCLCLRSKLTAGMAIEGALTAAQGRSA